MARKTLKVGIVGLGHLHPRAYMPLFQQCGDTKVVCAFDKNEKLLKSFCDDFGLEGYCDLGKMLSEQKIDMAVMFLPHSDCADAAIQCAENGVHLMVEKPIADSSAGVEKVIAAAKKNNVLITTGYCWRYHPVIEQMKSILKDNILGSVVSVEARLAAGKTDRYIVGNSEWMLQKAKSGGGPMYNLGVHWIDLLLYLLADDIVQVCAVNTKTSNKYDVEDSSVAMLKFKSGVVGVLNVSYIVPDSFPCGRDLYIGIKGSEGVLSYCPKYEGEQGSAAPQTDILEVYSNSQKIAGSLARKYCFALDKVAGYSGYMGKAYVEGFVDSILKHKQPFITAGEAVKVLKVVEAIYESDKKKQWIGVNK